MVGELWSFLVIVAAAVGQEPLNDAELSRHLTVVRTQIADVTVDPVRREQLALDMAATLDRAAYSVADGEVRRQRWALAIDLLDRFNQEHTGLPQARQLRFQAAVYRLAQGQSWLDASRFEPGDPRLRERGIALLDDSIERLRGVSVVGDRTSLGENLRYRLAEALADRAELEPDESPDRRERETEALDLLKEPATEVGLTGYWHLLRADLSRRLGKPQESEKELDAAAKAKPAPPERALFEVRVPLRVGQKQFAEAIQAVDASHLDPPLKGLWKVQIDLAQLAGPTKEADRSRIESDLFREVQTLRAGNSPYSKLAVLELGRGGIEPGEGQPAEAWDAMADAYEFAGKTAQAGNAATRAADRAMALGQAASAARFRLRAGAFFYRGGKFAQADAALSRVADDPAAGPLRAKAGLLRAKARGRAVDLRLPGSSTTSYAEALERRSANSLATQRPTKPDGYGASWPISPRTRNGPSPSGRRSPREPADGSTPGWPSRQSIATNSIACSSIPIGM